MRELTPGTRGPRAPGELKFPSLRVMTPEQCLEAFPCPL
jgi:hypothetical protein